MHKSSETPWTMGLRLRHDRAAPLDKKVGRLKRRRRTLETRLSSESRLPRAGPTKVTPMQRSQVLRTTFLVGLGLLGVTLSYRWALGPVIPAVHPTRGAVVQKIVASGQVIPKARIRILSQVMGHVAEVYAEEGDDVGVLKPLIRLVDAEAMAQVEGARAALEQAQAKGDQFRGVSAKVASEALRQAKERLTTARLVARREEELSRANASTKEALDQARSDVRLAQSQVETAEAQVRASAPLGSDSRLALALIEQNQAALKAAEARLAHYHIDAPLPARVLARDVEPGDGVQVGSPLMTLASLDPPRIRVQVDEKYLSLLQAGQVAKVTVDAYPGRIFEATLERLAPAINQERGAIDVRLVVKDPPPFLRFDMNASVEIVTKSAEDVLLVPSVAVQEAATDQPFVYTLKDGRVTKQKITIGLSGDQVFELTSGVAAQDLVLIPKEPLPEGSRARAETKG